MLGPFSPIQSQINQYFPPDTHPYRILENRIAKEIREDSQVLELGCGRDAALLLKFAGKSKCLYGIDLVEFETETNDAVLINEDISCMKSVPDASIDLAFSRSVMEHVNDVKGVYNEVHRVLKPGALYIFLTPNRYDYVSLISSMIPNRYHAKIVKLTEGRAENDTFPVYYKSNSFSQIRKLASQSDFKILALERLNQYPSYLSFSRVMFWLGCQYERLLNTSSRLDCLKGWIYCVLQK